MNWLDKTISWVSPQAGAKRLQYRALTQHLNSRASYDAAGTGRRNHGWHRGGTSSNDEIKGALAILRARHRDLYNNNPYATNAIRILVNNFVGTGVKPKAQIDNEAHRAEAQALINEWAQSTAIDFDDQLNLFGIQGLSVEAALVSGDALIVRQIERDPRLKVPLRMRVLEGDYLDHTKNGAMNGGYAVLGVQFNNKHQRVGYWLHSKHPGQGGVGLISTLSSSSLVPADDVIHLFEIHRPGQVRGVPRGVSGMQRTKILDDYQDARLEAQRSAACLVGVVTEPDAMPGDRTGDILPERLEPGMFASLKPGQDVKFNSPPSIQDAGGFIKTEQRSIAIAYGVPYAALTGDLSAVNFSASRTGALEFKREIDKFRMLRLIPAVCQRIAIWFDEACALAGINTHGAKWGWSAPIHQMQDPAREVAPMVALNRAGYKSKRTIVTELGYDPDEMFEELRIEREQARAAELVFDSDAGQVSQQGYQQTGGQSEPNDTD